MDIADNACFSYAKGRICVKQFDSLVNTLGIRQISKFISRCDIRQDTMIAQLQSALFQMIIDLVVVELLLSEVRTKWWSKIWVLRRGSAAEMGTVLCLGMGVIHILSGILHKGVRLSHFV